jgi:hypothetical protein
MNSFQAAATHRGPVLGRPARGSRHRLRGPSSWREDLRASKAAAASGARRCVRIAAATALLLALLVALWVGASPALAAGDVAREYEHGWGDGQIMQRSNASGRQTVWLRLRGQSRQLGVTLSSAATYEASVRYSNDNFGGLEWVALTVNGKPFGSPGGFWAQDTGDWGQGWNNFRSSPAIGSVRLPAGTTTIVTTVSGGDCCGVELDVLTLRRVG